MSLALHGARSLGKGSLSQGYSADAADSCDVYISFPWTSQNLAHELYELLHDNMQLKVFIWHPGMTIPGSEINGQVHCPSDMQPPLPACRCDVESRIGEAPIPS